MRRESVCTANVMWERRDSWGPTTERSEANVIVHRSHTKVGLR